MRSSKITTEIVKLFKTLEKEEKKKLSFLAVSITAASIFEILTIAAIYPFLMILTNEANLNENNVYIWLKSTVVGENQISNQIITMVFVLSIIFANAIRLTLYYLTIKIGFIFGISINKKVFASLVSQKYEDHLDISLSEVIANITSKSGIVIYNVILPAVNLLSVAILLALALGTFMLIAPAEAIISIIIIILLYAAINQILKNHLHKISFHINQYTTEIIKKITETFGLYREITLYSQHDKYKEYYSRSEYLLRSAQAKASFLAAAPKYVLETIAIVALALLSTSQIIGDGNIVPMIGLIAFGIQRLLPHVQQAYSSISSIQSSQHVLKEINELLKVAKDRGVETFSPSKDVKKLKDVLTMTEVSYALPSSGKVILKDVNAQLPIGSLIAIVGASGVGKSVLLDIITGLRRPMTGDLYIDNCKLYDHEVIKWRKNITYVPQHPFIFEGTIARNIAQTLPGEDLDYQKVKDAAKKAQINNWIETLPKSYESELEEGGRNLSGGQRQRICIARALYRSNRVLCLDESSNAIDEQTESELFNTLQKLKEKMLILVVTHRSDTLHHFDKVYEIKNGRLTDVR